MMSSWFSWLGGPWPWYVAGPLIGLIVPLLLLIGGRQFGISANLRHLCAATVPGRLDFFRYDWKREGGWNLFFALGIGLGGWVGARLLPGSEAAAVAPPELASWAALATWPGFFTLVVGGLLVGFGSRWAGGCTSGHAITGLAALQLPSLVAVLGFFAGGLLMTHLLLPLLPR
jgi:uncharacterized membrane protein YedE/YeeE